MAHEQNQTSDNDASYAYNSMICHSLVTQNLKF